MERLRPWFLEVGYLCWTPIILRILILLHEGPYPCWVSTVKDMTWGNGNKRKIKSNIYITCLLPNSNSFIPR